MEREQWLAIKNKDASYDGVFVYVNRKTGIICKPSCRKKTISPKSVIIFSTVEEAVCAGYRACKICHPENNEWKSAGQDLTEGACRIIEDQYKMPYSLDALADSLHINKYYLLRTFKLIRGITPLQYHNWYRCEKAKELLHQPELPVSYIALETGFNSSSHFSRVFGKIEGCTPTEYRRNYLKDLDGDKDGQRI